MEALFGNLSHKERRGRESHPGVIRQFGYLVANRYELA